MWIYKGTRRNEAYIYLPRADGFEAVPRALLEAMGKLTLVMALDLSADRALARADAREVLSSIDSRGFYLQMPPLDAPRPVKPH
ncbi:MAG: YcgL domain-containing protein [Gammaproteobacteria bacterium]